SGRGPVEFVAERDVPGVAAAGTGEESGPGGLVAGEGQRLGVGDGKDRDPLVRATVFVAHDRVNALVDDAARYVEPLLALLRAARTVGDVARQQYRQASRGDGRLVVGQVDCGSAVPAAGGVDSGELLAELGIGGGHGRRDGGDQQVGP